MGRGIIAMDLITYSLLKKYVKASLAGAGALQGQDGKSAYEIAVINGFSGTEEEWIASLAGVPGETPHIGENGNWFIGAVDTNVSATPQLDYNNLMNKPEIDGTPIEGDISNYFTESIPLSVINNLLQGGNN